jgi:hypothetical protein
MWRVAWRVARDVLLRMRSWRQISGLIPCTTIYPYHPTWATGMAKVLGGVSVLPRSVDERVGVFGARTNLVLK